MAIPQSFIQDLLARVDVVEVVGRYVQLKKGGANYLGLCPFHGEKSPSFTVSPTKQFYHCFGCGRNGNAIGFLMEHTGAGFVEAVKDLAQQVGMQVPEDTRDPAERERAAQAREKQATLNDVLEKAAAAYRRQLRESPRAIDYLKGRGLSGEIARTFGLGYAPEGWRTLASVFPDYDDPLLVESGLLIAQEAREGESARKYDRFRDRIMFPIRNVKGECIGFGGRVLDRGEPKYLNSPETPVFSKGRELYGLFEARQALREQGYVLVTEGYMDVVALAQLGFPNAVATLGTACTADHVQKLFRFTDAVVFSFDGDNAGRRAARRALDAALPWATDLRSVKFLFLPPEHDPDSFIREHGADAFARQVGDAAPLSRFVIEVAREGCDLDTAEGRARMASVAQPLWSTMPEGALKRQLLNEIAQHVQEDPRDLLAAWTPAAGGRSGGGSADGSDRGGARAGKGAGKGTGMGGGRPGAGAGTGADGGRRDGSPARAWSRRVTLRPSLEANARNVARLLLVQPDWWDTLTGADHEALCALDNDCGALFRWLDAQASEHGAQPLAALQVAWQGEGFQPLADSLVALDSMQPLGRVVDEAPPALPELQRAVCALRLDLLDQDIRALQGLPATDPSRTLRETALIREQFELKRRLATGLKPA